MFFMGSCKWTLAMLRWQCFVANFRLADKSHCKNLLELLVILADLKHLMLIQ